MKRALVVIRLLLLAAPWPALAAGAADATATTAAAGDRSWSADLLRQVWNEPGNADTPAPAEGLSLRSYQLRHLKLGEAGRAQLLVSLLPKLLPAGGSLKPDLPAQSLHILTTPTAHAAIWDLLSTLDQPAPANPAPAALPAEVQGALTKLAATPAAAEEILAQLRDLRAQVERQTPNPSVVAKPTVLLFVCAGLGILACGLGLVIHRARQKALAAKAAEATATPAALVLSPEKISAALAPLQQQWQQEVMGTLNQAAIRLEAWYQEQKRQKEALEQLADRQHTALVAAQTAMAETRTQWLADTQALVQQASGRFENVADRLENQAAQLAVQNDRVESLADELAHTVQELDRTKDEIVRLEAEISAKNAQLDASREMIDRRERQLTHEQARLAALSLLLEEGPDQPGTPPPTPPDPEAAPPAPAATPTEPASRLSAVPPLSPCPNQASNPQAFRYPFLPLDHPAN